MSRIPNRLIAALVVIAVAAPLLLAGSPTPATAQDEPAVDDPAQALALRHVPVVMLKAQEAPCDTDGEPYGPASVEIVLDNPGVVLRQLGPGDPVLQRAPSAADLFGLGEGFHLDFPGSALDPQCIYETDFVAASENSPPTVYAHIARQEDRPGLLALQYWIYWYYNDWNNKHESDWEGIQLLFEADTVEEALATEPVSVGYAQHEGGERAGWDDAKLSRDGDRPVVYSSAGSHASYFGSALYLGRGPSAGFGCDNTDGPSERVDPEVVLLPDAVDDPGDPLAWLAFDGRWGERQSGPFNGPTGPADKERWTEPVTWHDGLRSSSVVIPAGDNFATSVIERFCGVVETGSGLLLRFTRSPITMLVMLAVVALVLRAIAGRTSWAEVPLTPVVHRRRAGELLRAAGRRFRGEPGRFAPIGLIVTPVAVLAGVIGGLVAALPVVRDLLTVAGQTSGTNLFLTLVVGGFPGIVAIVVGNAAVSALLDEPVGPVEAARRVWSRRRPLLTGTLRAIAIVGGLLITIVGIPWALRQVVRYQFLGQAVMLDDSPDARSALARSSELVRGRWWHTALVLIVIDGAVGILATVTGLLLLLAFSGLPLWLFSVVVTAVAALLTPIGALAQVYLYGDARAAADGVGSPERSDPSIVLG